jgi:hypothetical protein
MEDELIFGLQQPYGDGDDGSDPDDNGHSHRSQSGDMSRDSNLVPPDYLRSHFTANTDGENIEQERSPPPLLTCTDSDNEVPPSLLVEAIPEPEEASPEPEEE